MVKSRERSAPLWALTLATMWLDIVFIPLFLAHRETVQMIHPGYGGSIIHAIYTHSIVGMLALSAALGALFLPRFGSRRNCADRCSGERIPLAARLVIHRPDMPVLPGAVGHLPLFGFGLWNDPRVSALVELTLVLAGALLYWQAAREVTSKAGKSRRLASLSAALLAAFGVFVLFLDYTS